MQGVAYLLDIVGVKYGVAQEADNQRSLMNPQTPFATGST